jgi:polyphenol oxidase
VAWGVGRWGGIAGLEHGFGGRGEAVPADVTTLRQVHGRRVLDVAELRVADSPGDALVTSAPGARIGVWTADCVPVQLVAPKARVAAVLHCGWRGSAAGIAPAALEVLEARYGVFPADLEAALGPSIGGCCYEVGEEVRAAFASRVDSDLAGSGFRERDGRLFLDLRTFLLAELAALGVPIIERAGPCTACHTDILYSYRREKGGGRQLSWIGWQS